MIFKDEHTPSIAPKIFFMFSLTIAVLLASYLVFNNSEDVISFLRPYAVEGNFTRQVIIISCLFIYLTRLFFTTFIFIKRKMVWKETFIITTFMALALFSIGRAGASSTSVINLFDYFGILLFLIGSWLNSRSEYTRDKWKMDANNKGKLYTEGLFQYSMHINYFGDILLFSGLAFIAQKFTLFVIPLAMSCIFIFYTIPALDKYLASKYGNDFIEYSIKTKKLIPWIY